MMNPTETGVRPVTKSRVVSRLCVRGDTIGCERWGGMGGEEPDPAEEESLFCSSASLKSRINERSGQQTTDMSKKSKDRLREPAL